MNKKTIIKISIIILILLIVSAVAGFYTVKRKNTSSIFPTGTQEPLVPTSMENVSEKISEADDLPYKIILQGNKLMLYFNDKLINETPVAPDVLPRTDIKALTTGIEYKTIEEALGDWESLCN